MEKDLQTILQEKPVQEQPPRGRNAVMNRWRESNPDYEGEPADDDLYDYVLSEADSYKSRYDKQNEVNSALAKRIAEDPRLGALIAGIMGTDENGNRRHPAYVIAKLYGKDFLQDEDALNDMEKGYAEYLEQTKKTEAEGKLAQENFLKSMKRVDEYAKANGLSDENTERLRYQLVQAAEDMLMGNFSDQIIETVAKGITYDADVQEAANTGYVEGKNEKVEMKFGKIEGEMPAMGTVTRNPVKPKTKQIAKKSFFDEMETVE